MHTVATIPPELIPAVRQIMALRTVGGFVAAYERNLAKLGNKTAAYEATEGEYELYVGERRYDDVEVFRTKLSLYYRKQKQQSRIGGPPA